MEARNLSWHVLLGELRVGAIDHSNTAISGPLRSIFSIASGEFEHEVEHRLEGPESKGSFFFSNSECMFCVDPGSRLHWVS